MTNSAFHTAEPAGITYTEALAERVAAEICLSPERIVEAFLSGCETFQDFARMLEIPEDAFRHWLAIMQNRYGMKPVRAGRYMIQFEPLPVRVYALAG